MSTTAGKEPGTVYSAEQDKRICDAYCSRMNDVVMLAFRRPNVIQCRVCLAESEIIDGKPAKTRDNLTHAPGCVVGKAYELIAQHEATTGETSKEPFTRRFDRRKEAKQ